MKIAFFVLGRHVPSTRFRVMQYLPILAERRVKFSVIAMEPSFCVPGFEKLCKAWHYLRALHAAGRSDLVFLQKPGFIINRWMYLTLLFRPRKKVVFDLDDAIFLDYETGSAQDERWLKKLAFILARSRLVVAGNSYLAEFCKKHNPRVAIIPTPIDCETYRPRESPPPAGQRLTVGWMGTDSNLQYLSALIPIIEPLLAEMNARFLLVTGPTGKSAGFTFSERVVFKEWRAESEVDDLRLFDIGIMPLADNAYTRGKCGFKLLQYMAVGIPVVASPVGMNREIVEEGINGFLAGRQEEWLDKLELLCRDRELRERMGRAGREKAVTEYSLQKFAGPWLSLLQQAAAAEK